MSTASTTSQATGSRLLQAAVEVFAEVGYRDATLREICRRAGANNAAINYHFRDKEHLYLAVIEHLIQEMRAHMPQAEVDPTAPPEKRLREFIRSFLWKVLGKGPPTWLMKLIAQEMAEPTQGLDFVVEKAIGPFAGELEAIVRDLAGPLPSGQQVMDCVISIFGQCGEYHRGREVLTRLGSYKVFDEAAIEHVADHITRFSLAGIRAVAAAAAGTECASNASVATDTLGKHGSTPSVHATVKGDTP